MLSALKKFFAQTSITESDSSEEHAAEQLLPAAAAMLLLEVAWADHNISDIEIAVIGSSLQSLFELQEPFVSQLLEDSRQKHKTSVGVYEYTRTLNETLSEDEKYQLLVALWRLALSDSDLHALEEHVIRRISDLLYVPHTRFIAAKRKARALGSEP